MSLALCYVDEPTACYYQVLWSFAVFEEVGIEEKKIRRRPILCRKLIGFIKSFCVLKPFVVFITDNSTTNPNLT